MDLLVFGRDFYSGLEGDDIRRNGRSDKTAKMKLDPPYAKKTSTVINEA